jgi:hypothetical protein
MPNSSVLKDLNKKVTDAVLKEETSVPLQLIELENVEPGNEVEKIFEPAAPADLPLTDSNDVANLPTDPPLNTDLDANAENSELTE